MWSLETVGLRNVDSLFLEPIMPAATSLHALSRLCTLVAEATCMVCRSRPPHGEKNFSGSACSRIGRPRAMGNFLCCRHALSYASEQEDSDSDQEVDVRVCQHQAQGVA